LNNNRAVDLGIALRVHSLRSCLQEDTDCHQARLLQQPSSRLHLTDSW